MLIYWLVINRKFQSVTNRSFWPWTRRCHESWWCCRFDMWPLTSHPETICLLSAASCACAHKTKQVMTVRFPDGGQRSEVTSSITPWLFSLCFCFVFYSSSLVSPDDSHSVKCVSSWLRYTLVFPLLIPVVLRFHCSVWLSLAGFNYRSRLCRTHVSENPDRRWCNTY